MKEMSTGLIGRRSGISVLMIFSVVMIILCAGMESESYASLPPSPPGFPGTVKWSSGLIAGNNFDSPAAIGANGRIYVGKQDGYLYAFLPGSGTYKWRLSLDSSSDGITSAPAIGADGTIYLTTVDGHLFAVTDNDTAGGIKWQYPATGDAGLGAINSSPALGTDGTVYVGSADDNIYAISSPISGSVGTLKWQYATPSQANSSPAIGVDGTIYAGSSYGYIYALNPNGALKWRYPAPDTPIEAIDSSPAIGADGTIYVGAGSLGAAYLYAINPNGTLKWKYTGMQGGIDYASPVIAPDGTIYLGTQEYDVDGRLYAITDAGSQGNLKWQYAIPVPSWASAGTIFGISDTPAVDSNGTIYFGASDGLLYALKDNGANATKSWSCLVNTDYGDGTWATGSIPSSPAIGSDGTIYIGSAGQDVFYAINGDSTGPANSPWPLFHYDAQRAGQGPANLVDLIVSSVGKPPTAAAWGSGFPISSTVKNQGTLYAGASVTQFYLSTSGIRDGNEILVGKKSVIRLAGGKSSTGTSMVTIPASTPLGPYYLIACADDTEQVTETYEKNNCKATIATTTITAPDLTEYTIGNPPASVALGGKFSVTDTVKNLGGATAPVSVTQYFLSSEPPGYKSVPGVSAGSSYAAQQVPGAIYLGKRSVPVLKAQASSAGRVILTVPVGTPLGDYYLLACADDLEKIAESNESNNCKTSTTATTIVVPDLVESAVTFSDVTVPKSKSATPPHSFTVSDTVTNTGPVPATPSVTRYYISANSSKDSTAILLTGSRAVPALKANSAKISKGNAKVTIPLNQVDAFTTYYLFACSNDTNKPANGPGNCASSTPTQISCTSCHK